MSKWSKWKKKKIIGKKKTEKKFWIIAFAWCFRFYPKWSALNKLCFLIFFSFLFHFIFELFTINLSTFQKYIGQNVTCHRQMFFVHCWKSQINIEKSKRRGTETEKPEKSIKMKNELVDCVCAICVQRAYIWMSLSIADEPAASIAIESLHNGLDAGVQAIFVSLQLPLYLFWFKEISKKLESSIDA